MRNIKRISALTIIAALAICAGGIAFADETKQDAAQKPKEIDNPFAPTQESAKDGEEQEPTQEADQETEKQSEISSEKIEKWIRQLDSDKYAERESATLKLIEAGDSAIESLRNTAAGESREAASRAVRVLKELMDTGNTKANNALKKLAEGDNERAARRAKKALETAKAPSARPRIPAPAAQRRFGFQIQGVQGGVKMVQLGNVNGEKTLNITENGTKIHITDSPKNGIKIKVTEQVNGKDKVTEYAGKDKEDLKKKHPEGFKIYEKHMKANGMNALGGIGGRIILQNQFPGQVLPAPRFGNPRPVAPPKAFQPPAADPKKDDQKTTVDRLTKELKEAQVRIEKLEKELKRLQEKSPSE